MEKTKIYRFSCKANENFDVSVLMYDPDWNSHFEKIGNYGVGSLYACIGDFVKETIPNADVTEGLVFYNEEGKFLDAIYSTDTGFRWVIKDRRKSGLPN